MIKKYIEQLKSINKDGIGYYNFLLDYGRDYSSKSSENKKAVDEYSIRSKSKGCFYNAQQLTIFSNGKFGYCEGYATTKTLKGILLEHAWNIKNGKIVDITWDDGIEYFGIEMPYKWIRKKFYEYAFKHNISDSHLMRYWGKNIKMAKEFTKIINKKCQDCGMKVSILCNETAKIVAVRCPSCILEFNIRNKKYEKEVK